MPVNATKDKRFQLEGLENPSKVDQLDPPIRMVGGEIHMEPITSCDVLSAVPRRRTKMGNLLYWAVTFLVVAIVAALFGFGGVAGTAVEGAKLLF